jgi:pyridoxal phosphate enzyme (YggS family)
VNIKSNYQSVGDKVKQLALKYHREINDISLIAVSKGRKVGEIEQLITYKQRDFAESYTKEAIDKIMQLSKYDLIWHFIGRIQTNKIKEISKWFNWVHSVDNYKKATLLNYFRGQNNLDPINICLQINVAESHKKGGICTSDIDYMIQNIISLPHIKLRGFMTIIDHTDSFLEQTALFGKLKDLFENYKKQGHQLDTLSMGMSHDYEAAISCGATMIRIGRDIFEEKKNNFLYNEIHKD